MHIFCTQILQMYILKTFNINIKTICLIDNFDYHQLKMNILKIKISLEILQI
jgi:hypothetical protein